MAEMVCNAAGPPPAFSNPRRRLLIENDFPGTLSRDPFLLGGVEIYP